jgi:hypothetical protein
VVPGSFLPVVAVETAPCFVHDGLDHHPVRALEAVWASRSSILTWSRLRAPVMLWATLLKATWIPLQITDALSSGSSLGRATAASAWENLPTTSPYDNCRRYSPLGR